MNEDHRVEPFENAAFSKAVRNVRWLFAAMVLMVVVTTWVTYFFGNRVLGLRNLTAAHRLVIT